MDMKIHVQCHKVRGEEVPRGFRLGERFLIILRVAERWEDGGHRYFRVIVTDGRQFVLRQDTLARRWELERVAA